jgi:signal transduction histidine kinase
MARWFAGVLGLLALVLLVRLVLEWRRYATGGHVIGRRQMTLRVVSAVDLVVLLALVLTGAGIDFPTATSVFVYGAVCLVLALAAMIMAIVDLRMLRTTHGERRAESYRRLSMYIRRLEQSRERRSTRGE